MNSFLKTVAGIVVLTAGSLSANAAEYADINTNEQALERRVDQTMPAGNREAYCASMKNRMQSMSNEERERFGNIIVTPVEKKIVMVRVLATDPAVGITSVTALPAINNSTWLSRICSRATEKTSLSAASPSAPGYIYSM